MEQFSSGAIVIGAGAVGLAVARALALAGHETVILEKNMQIGMETSARNSEVIHAGIYYPQGSLKAMLCVEGKRLLYDFCESHGVGFRRLGKLIVGRAGQEAQLAAIARAAANNGVTLEPLSRTEIAALEPELAAAQGLFSASTGIIDSHQYMLALLGNAEGAGATLVRGAEVIDIARGASEWQLTVTNAGETFGLATPLLVNSGGLWAQKIARRIEGLNGDFVPPLFLAKGSYATLSGRSPFRHLVYPIPEPGGLGVHLTLDMAGAARFGPDVEWLDDHDPAHIDYNVRADIGTRFAERVRGWWPGISADRLAAAYSGVRPKTAPRAEPAADFRIDGPAFHGLPGLVNLFGIESPGLTASLAIAHKVAALLEDASK
jgi:L-2-hydroxyglutarate oxidase LhgO